MKKKFGIWLNIVTICLCICAIAVGVYSATTAKITAGGKIGFVAHGCKVSVNGYIYGHAMKNGVDDVDGLPVAKPTTEAEKIKLSNTDLVVEAGVTSEANSKLDLGKRYFSDMQSDDGKPNDIFIVIVVTNATPNFKVRATMDLSESATKFANGKVIATPYCNFSQVLETSGTNQTAEFVYRLELQKTGDVYAELNADTTSISLKMSFEKYSTPTTQDYSHLTFGSYNNTAKTVCVTGFDNSIANVIIPFEIQNGTTVYTVTKIDEYAFSSKNKMINVSLPNSITYIDEGAFQYCENLIGLFCPDSIEDMDAAGMLYGCTSLVAVKLSNNANFTTMYGSFVANCTSLTEITIPANISYMGTLAPGCTSLKTITCLAITPPTISFLAANCPALKKIYVPSASVNAYKAANVWKDFASIIEGI